MYTKNIAEIAKFSVSAPADGLHPLPNTRKTDLPLLVVEEKKGGNGDNMEQLFWGGVDIC